MKRILVVLSFFLGFAVASATADMRGHDGAEQLLTGELSQALERAPTGGAAPRRAGGEFQLCHALSVVDGMAAPPSNLRPVRLIASAGALASDPVFRREPKPPRL